VQTFWDRSCGLSNRALSALDPRSKSIKVRSQRGLLSEGMNFFEVHSCRESFSKIVTADSK